MSCPLFWPTVARLSGVRDYTVKIILLYFTSLMYLHDAVMYFHLCSSTRSQHYLHVFAQGLDRFRF